MYKFDVFGTQMSILRKGGEWQLFKESATGMRSRIYDVVIPVELAPTELAKYLDDIYHEMATEKSPKVTLLT